MKLLIFFGVLFLTQLMLESASHRGDSRLTEADMVPENRLYGGVPVTVDQYKFMVAIILKRTYRRVDDDRFLANAVIVHHRWALTTQNALASRSKSEVLIRGNSTNWNNSAEAIDHTIIAETWSERKPHCKTLYACQLVMYRVDPPFTGLHEKKVKLTKDFWYPPRLEVEVLSWGVYRYDFHTEKPRYVSEKLRSVILRLQNTANCFMTSPISAPRDRLVCTDAGFRGTCDHDIGGAMVSYGRLIALVIVPRGCRHSIDYYIKINKEYVNWINVTKKSL